MQTEEISEGIYKTILVPLSKKLGVHPIVIIEEIYNQYGPIQTSPNIVSGLVEKETRCWSFLSRALTKTVVV